MKKFLFLFSLLFFFFPRHAFASNFSTQYKVTYTINPDTTTHVNFHVSLTNLTSRYYASSYTIHLGFQDMQRITASDPDGPIIPNIVKNGDDQSISLDFNHHTVGVGNALIFDLNFDTKDIAQKEGSVWEINIPGLSNKNDFSGFDVYVLVPGSLGTPQYIKPDFGDNGNFNGRSLHFTKEELGTAGISIAFGKEQNYAFHLTYHLGNKNVFPVRTEIALPPDTNYQKIILNTLTPKPLQVTQDTDGNWLAEYRLLPGQKYDVLAQGFASISLLPEAVQIQSSQLSTYLEPKQYWEALDPQIKKTASGLKTPLSIYNYLVNKLQYDFGRVSGSSDRLGALQTLLHPNSAVCLEFTDLFIALARSSGIPARELDGYAFTKNSKERPLSLIKDVLHAWPEYYDTSTNRWIMVDPTWGNTTGGVDYFHTLDFDHFTFVVKGQSSMYPIPAGGYKLSENENEKDIGISFANTLDLPEIKRTLLIKPMFPLKIYAGFLPRGSIQVTNTGNVIENQQFLEVTTTIQREKQRITIPAIPPFGSATIPVVFQRTSFLTNAPLNITISLSGQTVTEKVMVSPLYLDPFFFGVGGVFFAVFFITAFIITTRSRRVPLPQPKE